LRNADLRNADLRNADLRNADLRNADLENADLENADLENADLRNADLRNADLRNADLRNAKSIFIFNKIDGRTCYAVVGENGVMVKAGCFWGDISKFEAACKDKYPNDSIKAYAAQIQYLKAIENQIKQSK